MDQTAIGILEILGIWFGIPFIITIIVAIVGCVCLRPEEMLRRVFPFIKKSGNHNVVFGFIMGKQSVKCLYCQLILVVAFSLTDILFNSIFTMSFTYNPYDGLSCYGYNGTEIIKVTSEEQAEEYNGSILCVGWNFDIGGAIGHTVAMLTLSWILVYIVLWIKIKWWNKIINCARNRKFLLCGCCSCAFIVSQFFFLWCTMMGGLGYIHLSSFLSSTNQVPLKAVFDILLLVIVLNSGLCIFPTLKRSKSLKDHCKEAVEKKQGEEERALEEIRNRLRSRVQDHQIQVDLLLELAEQECKKALGDMYHYGTEEYWNNINEDEMQTIAQVAYRKVTTNDGGAQYNNGQQYNTRQGASINGPTERDRLLGDTRRNNNNYSHFN